jgi:hypothetical protein
MLVLGVTDAARVRLQYKAGHRNAVSCSSTHLFVYEAGSRFVHMVELPGPDGHVIWSIQYINPRRLVAAMGPGRTWDGAAVTELLTAKVQ